MFYNKRDGIDWDVFVECRGEGLRDESMEENMIDMELENEKIIYRKLSIREGR